MGVSAVSEVLIVVESMFGNGLQIADVVAERLRSGLGGDDRRDVSIVHVGDAPHVIPSDVRLLIVGGPTHLRGLSRSLTRLDAARQLSAVTGVEVGLREWLTFLRAPEHQVAAAAWDTRANAPWASGSAAAGVLRRLHALGMRTPALPGSFAVTGMQGPLAEGELAKAAAWADEVALWWGAVVAA